MSAPTPIQSFLGGVGLALHAQLLLFLNGTVLGISGFLHRGVRGEKEALLSVAGFLAGGLVIGLVEGESTGPNHPTSVSRIVLSGFLVGVGTKACSRLPIQSYRKFNV